MLEHIECPKCSAPNLTTEVMCFACGASLRPRRKRPPGERPAEAPWPLWVAVLIALLAAAFAGWHVASWIAGLRTRADLEFWHLPAAGAALIVAGQIAFWEARRRDRRWWRLRRAPELPLSRATTGDAVWARGRLACDTPLIAPYTSQECAYYRYSVREREQGQAGWRETERGTKAVDFRLAQEGDSVYVPSGAVLFDAPLFADSFIDVGGTTQVRVWALSVGMPISVCGLLAGETSRPRLDPLDEFVPIVATWRLPGDYVRLVGRRARIAHLSGWVLTVVGLLVLIAGIAGA
ncbi:MAG: hypothetical protein JSV79_13930 [Armatimonadota bacterium]|nr:MAG: hypothetical protein JSV79_13930 [Armatimonadota bacterium]